MDATSEGQSSWIPQAHVPLRLLADTPIADDDDDVLGFAAYADAVAELIDDDHIETPLTIAITGPWGAGKTSLARMIERRLRDWPRDRRNHDHVTCWFNAWIHDDAPNVGAALAAAVAREASRNRRLPRRLLSPLPSVMLAPTARWRRRVAFAAGVFAFAALVALSDPVRNAIESKSVRTDITTSLPLGSAAVVLVAAAALWPKLFGAAQNAVRFIGNPSSEAALGAMSDVREQLGTLIRQATGARFGGKSKRLVILVDDVERCRPPQALKICEVASQLLSHRSVVTVLIADMAAISRSAEANYASANKSREQAAAIDSADEPHQGAEYGRQYLEKVVQIQVALPQASPDQIRRLIATNDPKMHGLTTSAGDLTITQRVSIEQRLGLASESILEHGRCVSRKVANVWREALPYGWSLFWYTFLGGGLVGALYGNRPTSIATNILQVIWALMVFVFLTLGICASVSKSGQHREEERMRTIIESAAAETNSKDTIEDTVRREAGHERESLATRELHALFTNEYAEAAEAVIREFASSIPRNAKRMRNHSRMLARVVANSEMPSAAPKLDGGHLGKWIVLLERWPQLAVAVTAEPARMKTLETVRELDSLSKQLAEVKLVETASDELLLFLQCKPMIATVIKQLASIEPVARRG